MSLKKEHDILDLLLLCPALLNPLHAGLPYAGNRQESVRLLLNDSKRILAEFFYNSFRKFRTDSSDKTAAEVLLNPISCSRQRLLEGLHRELPAVFRIHTPAAANIKNRSDMHLRHRPDHGDKVGIILHTAFDHRISILFILIGNSLNDAPDMFHETVLSAK